MAMVNRFPDIPRTQRVSAPAARLQTTLGMYVLGIEMVRTRLRTENPAWSDDELIAALTEWRRQRGWNGWGSGFRVSAR